MFRREWRYLMPYHNMRQLYLDDKQNYAQHVMTARARHMDGSKFREVQVRRTCHTRRRTWAAS